MADDLLVYKSWLLGFPCRVQPCVAAVMVHHHTAKPVFPPWVIPPKGIYANRGLGQRSSDFYGMPLCFHAHNDLHDKRGHFEGWTQEQINVWQDEQVAAMHALFDEEVARDPRSPLAKVQSAPWEPPADKARERRERKRKRGRRGGLAAIDEFQRRAPNAYADIGATIDQLEPPEGHYPDWPRQRAAIVEYVRDFGGQSRLTPDAVEAVSELALELAGLATPFTTRTT